MENVIEKTILVNGEAINEVLFECGGMEDPYPISDIIDEWELSNDVNQALEPYREWSIWIDDNINDENIDHDGSMFDIRLNFESPDGDIYSVENRMSLMLGWNFKEETILTKK